MVSLKNNNLSSLDQPMTNSTAMDSKMFVQSTGPVVSAQVRSNFEEMTAASSSMSGVRRRSGPQGLRSPTAKRPVSAPVALQGWLYKQGSEGLMLWKKRWFVLTDYCVFYYKGPEEEKLLGSILLPSYKVSICRPEEKINKKFAFKAEHANMRTYHFAAENRDSMNQWVNALTLATLLQDPTLAVNGTISIHGTGAAEGDLSGRPSVSSMSSYLNQSADDSDSGFHGFQSRDVPSHVANDNSSPNSVNTAVFSEHNAVNCNGNSNNDNNAISKNVPPNEVQPAMNGWIQQSSPYSETGTLKKQMQQQQQQQECTQQRQVLLQQLSEHQHVPQTQRHMHILVQQQKEVAQLKFDDSKTETMRSTSKNFGHPVYANAPPKPRRLTDNQNDYPTVSYGAVSEYRKSPISVSSGATGKNLASDYGRNSVPYMTKIGLQQSQQAVRTDKSGLNYGYNHLQNTERRTPDTYGRSDKLRNNRTNGDYEDIYGVPQLYQRPSEPVGYSKGTSPVPISFPVYLQQRQQVQPHLSQYQQHLSTSTAPQNVITRESRLQQPPRPHSADFLEFESTRRSQQQDIASNSEPSSQQRRPQRPKSSLDIVNPSDAVNDNYFYSEERYAAQMRQSAAYLHQTPQHHQQIRNQSLSRATTPSKMTYTRENDSDDQTSNLSKSLCPSTDHVHQEHLYDQQKLPQLLQRHAGTCINEAKLRRSLRERRSDWTNCDIMLSGGETESKSRKTSRGYEPSIDRRKISNHMVDDSNEVETCYAGYNAIRRSIEQQQFARSASARLPRTRHPALLEQNNHEHGYDLPSPGQDSRDGERKMQQREESMKRLLEWKQRMLQSPLTRKPSTSTYRGTVQNELSTYYKQQAVFELAAHEASVSEVRHSRRKDDVHRPHLRSKSTDGRRTVANVPRYNSYSSDDEDLGDVRRKRTRRPSHAGRSPRQFGDSNRPSASPAQATCIPTVESSRRVPNDINNVDVSKTPLVRGSIPPDAGYEEIDFRPILKTSSSTYLADTTKTIEPYPSTTHNLPKKPSSILKTSVSSSRNVNQEAPSAGSIRGDSWNSRKNVQWNSTNCKEEWDEQEVIKEFTYQYIKPDEAQKADRCTDRLTKSKNMNLVQSRIKSFESNIDCSSPVKETLSMQEPLKISPSQATEAHVSKLDSSTESPTNRSFESAAKQKPIEKCHMKQASTDSNKSVKDLLADFERKSQLVKEEHNKHQTVQHRGVFSDTEALLYDTESDHDQREKSEEEQEEETKRGQNQRIKGQSVQNDMSYSQDNAMKTDRLEVAQTEAVTEVNSPKSSKVVQESENASIIVNTRLSLAESLVTHGDQLSGESGETSPILKSEDINLEEHYLPMSPRKAILDPNNDDLQNPKMMENLFANLEHEESSYVEMTHNAMSHSLLAPNSERNKHDSGDYSTLDTAHYELVCVSDSKMEPVYMEVNQLANKEEKNTNKKVMKNADRNGNVSPSRSDLPDIVTALKSDSSDADDESSRDLDSVDAPRHPRFSLSDTFRPASYYLGVSRTMIAELHDSSDSELVSPPPIPTSPPPLDDLDSLEIQDSTMLKNMSAQGMAMKDSKVWTKAMGQAPSQRPSSRFSDAAMNSTFRDSRVSLESASGSDSVELRNHDEKARRHKQLKRRPVSDEVCEVLDSLDELESIGSRFDGTSIDVDQYFEELQARDAFNLNLYTKDLSYNSIYGFNENVSVADKLQKTTCHDMSRKINLISKGTLNQPFRHETRSKTSSASSLPSMRVTDLPPSHQHSQSFTGDMHYENISSFSPLRRSPAIRSDSEQIETEAHPVHSHIDPLTVSHSRESSFSITSNIAPPATSIALSSRKQVVEHLTQLPTDSTNSTHHLNHSINSISQDTNFPRQDSDQKLQRQDLSQYPRLIVRPNSRQSHLLERDGRCSQNDQSGAPYYYSDLQAGINSMDTQITRLVGHTSRLPQLNNQRDDAQRLNKRNDISRLVNPIPRQMPRQIPVDDAEEARRIAAELRKTTCRLLSDNKVDLVDKRNLYEADTLKRVKSTDPLPDPFLSDINSVNLYPQGLRDKSSTQGNIDGTTEDSSRVVQVSHRRSRSLEDLLDDVDLQNLVRLENRPSRVSSASPSRVSERIDNRENFTNDPPVSIEDPWEQDSLWRENLRRVSLRHARSLDNLENSPRQVASNVEPRGRSRITRGATYVNDSVNVRRETYLGETFSDRQRGNHSVDDENEQNPMLQLANDFDYESLSVDRLSNNNGAWNRENETCRKPLADDMNNFLDDAHNPLHMIQQSRMPTGSSSASFELDREKLRQWDLLSSACLLQEQQRTSLADSSRGLPSIDRFGDSRDLRTANSSSSTITNKDTRTANVVLPSQTAKSNDVSEVRLDPIDNLPDPQQLRTVETFDEEELKEVRDRPTASGSGSVIGRDPLPPRAMSTSQLPQTQSSATVSTLPLLRTRNNRCVRPLPLHQSNSEAAIRLKDHPSVANSPLANSANNGHGSSTDMTSPWQSTHLISPASHLRIISPVSSPSDSEVHYHSSTERILASPLEKEVNQTSASYGSQPDFVPDSCEQLYKRSAARLQQTGIGNKPIHSGSGGLAGELLGRTHEELVLLLIQLRRQSATLCKAMETCRMEIDAQARLSELDTPRRLENLQKLDDLKRHLIELEKQYDKGKPLVNLVDNMVKLGSLYNRHSAHGNDSTVADQNNDVEKNLRNNRDRVEFNQRVQEQRLLAEERKDWDRLSSDHGQLQAKVQQLYKLDRLLQEESGTLQGLQQDKEILEKALGGLRYKLQGNKINSVEAERYKKQQVMLERELSRVRLLLAHNSKKLEETVAENARLEQDLVVLRQKLQASRRYTGNMVRDTSGTTAILESELRRVQQLVGDLQRQRQELSLQVRQLTEKSHNLAQQIMPQPSSVPQVHHLKKRTQNSWLVTDLDSGITLDHGTDRKESPSPSNSSRSRQIESTDIMHLSVVPSAQSNEQSAPFTESSGYCSSPSYRQDNELSFRQAPQNHITALSPQLREQIQQHQLKQQLLKDQMQGKNSPVQANILPLYINTHFANADATKFENELKNTSGSPPAYIPPPQPPQSLPPSEEALLMNGLMHNREKQEIKTVRIVKRESERRQRDRGEKTGNVGIPLTHGYQNSEGAKMFTEADNGSTPHFENDLLRKVNEESAMTHAQSTHQLLLEEDNMHFQRSMSLPRGFGGHPGILQGPVQPPPRSDSMHALKNIMARRYKIRFDHHAGGSESTLSPYTDSSASSSHVPISPSNYSTSPSLYSTSIHDNFYHTRPSNDATQSYAVDHLYDGSTMSMKTESSELISSSVSGSQENKRYGSAASIASLSESLHSSPIFKSEAAKQIIKEVSELKIEGPKKRQIPKKKRRHYTVSSSKPLLDLEDTFSKMEIGRARDDLDMERALRPRINTPDVVRSTLGPKELKYNESTIDQLLGTPNKIVIPERYIPEKVPELTVEEQQHRLKKADAIRKMLSETTVTAPEGGGDNVHPQKSGTLKKKVAEEKRQRDHILQLNQILAKQVMEKSKMVAVKALATLPLNTDAYFDDEDLSPVIPLPIYQQRENFYS